MNINTAVQKWEPGSPARKRSRSAMEAPYSPLYSPAYPVENFSTDEAIAHAAEVTGAQEGWSTKTVDREKKAALAKQTKKAGRKHRKSRKGRRRTGRARPPPKEDKYPEEDLELLYPPPGGRRRYRR